MLEIKMKRWGAWGAQSVRGLIVAQVTISRFVGLSPVSGSVLTAQSLGPASDSVSPSLCPSPAHSLSLSRSVSVSVSLSKINTLKSFFFITK